VIACRPSITTLSHLAAALLFDHNFPNGLDRDEGLERRDRLFGTMAPSRVREIGNHGTAVHRNLAIFV
jgi:hypothetical protein